MIIWTKCAIALLNSLSEKHWNDRTLTTYDMRKRFELNRKISFETLVGEFKPIVIEKHWIKIRDVWITLAVLLTAWDIRIPTQGIRSENFSGLHLLHCKDIGWNLRENWRRQFWEMRNWVSFYDSFDSCFCFFLDCQKSTHRKITDEFLMALSSMISRLFISISIEDVDQSFMRKCYWNRWTLLLLLVFLAFSTIKILKKELEWMMFLLHSHC